MQLLGATALVTGVGAGNLGHYFVRELLDRGAKRVYATARRPHLIDAPGADTLHLDLTDPDSVTAAARSAPDVDVLINNASVFDGNLRFVDGDLAAIRRLFETNLYGSLAVIRAFAPILAANGGGAILDVLSAAAWSNGDGTNVYGTSKAALWRLTNAVRDELAGQGTLVSGLLFGMAATPPLKEYVDAIAGPGALDHLMAHPADVVRRALDGLEAGRTEVLGDQLAVDAKAALAGTPAA